MPRKLKKFLIEDVLKNPMVKKYSLWAYLIGSITLMIQLGAWSLWIIIPMSFVLCLWLFWASDAFVGMKEGGERIRWMLDARKKEKLRKKEADRR